MTDPPGQTLVLARAPADLVRDLAAQRGLVLLQAGTVPPAVRVPDQVVLAVPGPDLEPGLPGPEPVDAPDAAVQAALGPGQVPVCAALPAVRTSVSAWVAWSGSRLAPT